MLDSIEKITILFPKLKQQLLFLKEREKLLKTIDNLNSSTDSSSNIPKISSSTSSPIKLVVDVSTNDMCDQVLNEVSVKQQMNLFFPDQYIIPKLPQNLLQDIEAGALHKFAPHHANRQVLIDTVTHDLINKYNLFYPTHKQFDNIGMAIVGKLKLPLTKDNIGIWKDAVQTKLKRKRYEHKDHADVQHYQSKYSRFGSGRPVKKMLGEITPRDPQKQVLLMNYNDDTLNNIQMKTKTLRDDPEIDVHTRLRLWQETLHVRRKTIRDQSTTEILQEFPGYTNSMLIFEEVKMTTGVDLPNTVRRQIPILLEKMTTTPMFITDSPPIQLIRILCRLFGETVHQIYCNTAPVTPYPTLVFTDDIIHIYVDFIRIVSTASPDDGLALLLAMYAVFELNFNKNSRTIRLLYAVVFSDKRFLSNTIRNIIQEKKIDIYMEQNRKTSNNTNIITNNSTTNHINSQSSSQDELNLPFSSAIADVNFPGGIDLKIDTTVISDESNDKIEETSSSCTNSSKQTLNRRKPTKKMLTKSIVEKKKSISFDDNSDDDCKDDIIPSINAKLQSISRQTKKRKRFY